MAVLRTGQILIICPGCTGEISLPLDHLAVALPCPHCPTQLDVPRLIPKEIRHVLFPKNLTPRGPGAAVREESWQQQARALAQPGSWTKPIARIGHEVAVEPDRPRGEWKQRERPQPPPPGPAGKRAGSGHHRLTWWRRHRRLISLTAVAVLLMATITVLALHLNG